MTFTYYHTPAATAAVPYPAPVEFDTFTATGTGSSSVIAAVPASHTRRVSSAVSGQLYRDVGPLIAELEATR